jgi:hypothetical protein
MPHPWPAIRDKAIAFSRKSQDAEPVAFLFDLYEKYTSLLRGQSKAKKVGRKRKSP